jgi:hypothetical protein
MSIIEKGLREKVRFNLNGNVSIEDLYDFNSEILANLGGKLFEEVKKFTSDNPFKTSKKTKAQEKLQLSYDVVKYIYDIKVAEEEESANATIKKQEKEKLLSLLAKKQEEKLAGLTEEEIQAKLASL